MPRRPEIGNIQLYPNRPLKKSDRNGYVLKFYCPIKQKRIRRNCGTRDRREARRILRACRERLLNGEYVASDGAITAAFVIPDRPTVSISQDVDSVSWDACFDRYRENRAARLRATSLTDSLSRIRIAERIIRQRCLDSCLSEDLHVTECFTLDMLEYVQDRLMAGDESKLDTRAPMTVNSMMGALMAFVRYCARHGWIGSIPHVEKLDVDDVMKARPVTGEEFDRMLTVTPDVVGKQAAESWRFALRVLWESGFRIGDLVDFSWDDERHIHPKWSTIEGHYPTIEIPSSQKNGRSQEIPMLPGLIDLLNDVPKSRRRGWVANPETVEYDIKSNQAWFQPTDSDLLNLASRFSNRSIAMACGVSDTSVRKWLKKAGIRRETEFQKHTGAISSAEIAAVRKRSETLHVRQARRLNLRLGKDQVSRVISSIGKAAGIIVRQEDERTKKRRKYASAHDLRRGCAQRLINAGVSAETLKVVMRHKDFATTEKFYGAMRSAQSAAAEVQSKLAPAQKTPH